MFLCHIINDQQIPQAFRSFHFEVATCAGEKRNGKLDTVPRSTPESWNIYMYIFLSWSSAQNHMASVPCCVSETKWFWVIYFIVALKYLLFWKAPNNAMINFAACGASGQPHRTAPLHRRPCHTGSPNPSENSLRHRKFFFSFFSAAIDCRTYLGCCRCFFFLGVLRVIYSIWFWVLLSISPNSLTPTPSTNSNAG